MTTVGANTVLTWNSYGYKTFKVTALGDTGEYFVSPFISPFVKIFAGVKNVVNYCTVRVRHAWRNKWNYAESAGVFVSEAFIKAIQCRNKKQYNATLNLQVQ